MGLEVAPAVGRQDFSSISETSIKQEAIAFFCNEGPGLPKCFKKR